MFSSPYRQNERISSRAKRGQKRGLAIWGVKHFSLRDGNLARIPSLNSRTLNLSAKKPISHDEYIFVSQKRKTEGPDCCAQCQDFLCIFSVTMGTICAFATLHHLLLSSGSSWHVRGAVERAPIFGQMALFL